MIHYKYSTKTSGINKIGNQYFPKDQNIQLSRQGCWNIIITN
jgi:hypothetical protein